MSWRKEYKAAIKRRVDKIARRKTFDIAITDKEIAEARGMGQINPYSPSGLFLAQQMMQRNDAQQAYQLRSPFAGMLGSLGLGGLYGGALHITP